MWNIFQSNGTRKYKQTRNKQSKLAGGEHIACTWSFTSCETFFDLL